ncbi:hypothetical protein CBS147354_9628 [Penicillium roqueforti]|nr:hypothetical protein CBS147354_9628 [Penicillium roqueforti]
MPLQSPSLFERIEGLPSDLMQSAIESDILSKPLGSHEALHLFLQELSKDNPQPLIESAIKTALESQSLRQKIEVQWNLFRDYNHAISRQNMIEEGAPYDLASWSINYCSRCFNLLLDHQTVQPSSFCQAGYSFFWLAVMSDRDDFLIQRLVSLMEPKDLLSPALTAEANGDPCTIFQASTWNRRWFHGCWARLKPLPDNGLTSLGPDEMRNIWQFADVDLANELLGSGLDLGKPYPGNASPGWLEIVDRIDPEPMLNWLLSRGHQPPEKLLTYAAAHNCILAASWIMRHTESHRGWSEAALVAAESADNISAEMLEIILRNPAAKWKPDQTLSENIVIKTVNGVCQEREECAAMLSDDSFQEIFARMEDTAVRKIQALGEVVGNVQVLGMKITAEDAGLHHLTTALANMDSRL